MAGLDPAINFSRLDQMDGRLEAGHDKGTSLSYHQPPNVGSISTGVFCAFLMAMP